MVVEGKTWQRIAVKIRWEYLPPDSFLGKSAAFHKGYA
jgi:hypothetical protein